MRRLLWGSIVAVISQILFIFWILIYLRGQALATVQALQYLGVALGSAALLYLAQTIRRTAGENRTVRGSAAVAIWLSGLEALLFLAAAVLVSLRSPWEETAYGLGSAAAALSWLALVIAGFGALRHRPRPVAPAILLLLLFFVGISPTFELPYNLAGPSGEPDTSELVQVQGGELHPGQIYGLTVWGGTANVADFIRSLVDQHLVLVPRPAATTAQRDAMLGHMLVNSEAMAKAVGLQLAGRGKGAAPTGAGVVVTSITVDTPAAGAFQPGDVIVSLGDVPVTTWSQLLGLMQNVGPGEKLRFAFKRDGQPQSITLTTVPNPSNPQKGRVGIQGTDEVRYDIPVPISMKIPSDVGGPSLGLALTLQVVDQLTPGGITGKWRVAATGEVFAGGAVGAVGSVRYKAWGAERAGATVMFVPRENYEDAMSGATSVQVVPVDTVQDALAWLTAHQ